MRANNFASEFLPMRKKAGPRDSPGCHIHNSITCNAQGGSNPHIHGQRQGEAELQQWNATDSRKGGKLWPRHVLSVKSKVLLLKGVWGRKVKAGLAHICQVASAENSDRKLTLRWTGAGSFHLMVMFSISLERVRFSYWIFQIKLVFVASPHFLYHSSFPCAHRDTRAPTPGASFPTVTQFSRTGVLEKMGVRSTGNINTVLFKPWEIVKIEIFMRLSSVDISFCVLVKSRDSYRILFFRCELILFFLNHH